MSFNWLWSFVCGGFWSRENMSYHCCLGHRVGEDSWVDTRIGSWGLISKGNLAEFWITLETPSLADHLADRAMPLGASAREGFHREGRHSLEMWLVLWSVVELGVNKRRKRSAFWLWKQCNQSPHKLVPMLSHNPPHLWKLPASINISTLKLLLFGHWNEKYC